MACFFNSSLPVEDSAEIKVHRNWKYDIVLISKEQLQSSKIDTYITVNDREALALALQLIDIVKSGSKSNRDIAKKLAQQLKTQTIH